MKRVPGGRAGRTGEQISVLLCFECVRARNYFAGGCKRNLATRRCKVGTLSSREMRRLAPGWQSQVLHRGSEAS
jgi:hypothetical protein